MGEGTKKGRGKGGLCIYKESNLISVRPCCWSMYLQMYGGIYVLKFLDDHYDVYLKKIKRIHKLWVEILF